MQKEVPGTGILNITRITRTGAMVTGILKCKSVSSTQKKKYLVTKMQIRGVSQNITRITGTGAVVTKF